MDTPKVIVVTTTFYKSVEELRFRLAQSLVAKAVADGHIVVVVDASPIPEVAARLRELGALVFPQLHKGMGPGRREAFFHANEVGRQENADAILWTEPEKDDIARSIPNIVAPIIRWEADIVIPSRRAASWETWPEFQRQTEQEANTEYNRIFGTSGVDVMFGPVAWSSRCAGDFIFCYPKEFAAEDTYVQHFAPVLAKIRRGREVLSLPIDIVYPPEQKREEETALSEEMRQKRLWQRDSLIGGYHKCAGYITEILNIRY